MELTIYSNITEMLDKINLIYEEVKADMYPLKRLLKLSTLDIDRISNQAKERHFLLLKERLIPLDSWDKELKAVALNNCLYEILRSTQGDLYLTYIEHLEDELLKMSSFKMFISTPDIKKSRRLKQKAKNILKDVIAEVAYDFIMKKIPPEVYINIPIHNYFLSSYENHLFENYRDLSGILIVMLKNKIISFNTNNEAEIFQEVMLDFLEKAAKNKLKPRRSTLLNYIKGAFFNQKKKFYKKKTKRREKVEDFKNFTQRTGEKNEEIKNYEQTPQWVYESIKNILDSFDEKHRQLIFLKMKGEKNNKIIEIMNYKYKNTTSLKSQWYKVKRKLKLKFKDEIKKNPELQHYLYILLSLSDGDFNLF